MTRRSFAAIAVIAIAIAVPQSVRAQDAGVPCKGAQCTLSIDWGSGKTSASYPADRRYGSADDFETKFRGAMSAHGYRLTDNQMDGATILRIRPTMRERVLCDQLAGTNPDKSCTAMTNLAVSFAGGDPNTKSPGSITVTNRCGAGDTFLTMKVFAQYAADMIWWRLEGEAAKADRPVSNC